jgi:hypothetical protein
MDKLDKNDPRGKQNAQKAHSFDPYQSTDSYSKCSDKHLA